MQTGSRRRRAHSDRPQRPGWKMPPRGRSDRASNFRFPSCFADAFVNSQEWTLSRSVPELKVVSGQPSSSPAEAGRGGWGVRDRRVTCAHAQARIPWGLLVPGALRRSLPLGESWAGAGVAGSLECVRDGHDDGQPEWPGAHRADALVCVCVCACVCASPHTHPCAHTPVACCILCGMSQKLSIMLLQTLGSITQKHDCFYCITKS